MSILGSIYTRLNHSLKHIKQWQLHAHTVIEFDKLLCQQKTNKVSKVWISNLQLSILVSDNSNTRKCL